MTDGNAVVKAATNSYNDWHAHTEADLDFRSGKNTWAQTKAIWADTKSRGDSDLASFKSADKTFTSNSTSGCGNVNTSGADPKVKACVDRYKAMDSAVAAGRKVNGDWDAHVQMMKRKDHTNPSVYDREWRSMVDGSGTNQLAFAGAKAAYDKAPACTL